MWYKILLSIIAIITLIIIQVTFLGSFSAYWSNFNLALAILVILLFFLDFPMIMFFAVTAGFMLDLYSALPFGIFMLSFFTAALTAEFLLFNFFTNRSFYSVVFLGLAAVLAFNAAFLTLSGLTYLFNLSDFYLDSSYWRQLIYQLINTWLILIVLFLPINKLSRKFKPNFISS